MPARKEELGGHALEKEMYDCACKMRRGQRELGERIGRKEERRREARSQD